MPDGILDGMYEIRQADPATYQQYVRKLSGVFALLKMSWRINETRDKLEEGMLDNPRLGGAEQEVLEIRLARLERERDRFIGEKEQMERHVLPVLQEIVRDYRERQIGAAEAIMGIGKDTGTTGNQFGAQTPMGYALLGSREVHGVRAGQIGQDHGCGRARWWRPGRPWRRRRWLFSTAC